MMSRRIVRVHGQNNDTFLIVSVATKRVLVIKNRDEFMILTYRNQLQMKMRAVVSGTENIDNERIESGISAEDLHHSYCICIDLIINDY